MREYCLFCEYFPAFGKYAQPTEISRIDKEIKVTFYLCVFLIGGDYLFISDYVEWLCSCDLPLDFNLAFLSHKLARVRAPTLNLCDGQNTLIPLVDFKDKKSYLKKFHFDRAVVFETFVFSKFILIIYKGDI